MYNFSSLLNIVINRAFFRSVFEKNQLEDAFRYMIDAKHIGKVLIKVRNENESPHSKILALPRYHCRRNRSYIILGGLGGFGLELGTKIRDTLQTVIIVQFFSIQLVGLSNAEPEI